MSGFDMDKLMQQAAQMQEQVARMQEEAEKETAQSSVGGGLVKVTANGAGEVVAIEISPDAIDPDDPEALADLVLAGVNEAIRSARASVEAKAEQGSESERTAAAAAAAARARPVHLLQLAVGPHRPRPDRGRDLGLGLRFRAPLVG
jgi:DNA-binding YbaB/EbfC family protein